MGPDISGDPALNGIIPRSSLQVDAPKCRPHELPNALLGTAAFASRVGALVTHASEGGVHSLRDADIRPHRRGRHGHRIRHQVLVYGDLQRTGAVVRACLCAELVCLCASVGTRSSARGSARSMDGRNRLIDRAQIHDLRVKGHDNLQVRRIRPQRNAAFAATCGRNGGAAHCGHQRPLGVRHCMLHVAG
jgi:hypothetical protein